jgi:hypothetical protein
MEAGEDEKFHRGLYQDLLVELVAA